jgi:hypothetical protein
MSIKPLLLFCLVLMISCDDQEVRPAIEKLPALDMGNIGLHDYLAEDQMLKNDLLLLIPDQQIDDLLISSDQQIDQSIPLTPEQGLCLACDDANPCPIEGALCLTNTATGERFCGMNCSQGEECPRGTSCVDLGNGSFQCAPVQGSCQGYPPSDFTIPCLEDSDCQNGANLCRKGLCTASCQDHRQCPNNAPLCAAGICQPYWALGVTGCGLGNQCQGEIGQSDRCVQRNGGKCIDELISLPSSLSAFCTSNCQQDQDCQQGETCHPLSELLGKPDTLSAEKICIPQECSCLQIPYDQVDEALALEGLSRCDAVLSQRKLDAFPDQLKADAFRLSFFDLVHLEPFRALNWGAKLSADMGKSLKAQRLYQLIEIQAALIDAPIKDEAVMVQSNGLVPSLRSLFELAGRGNRFNEGAITNLLSAVPIALQDDLAKVLSAQIKVLEAKNQMLAQANIDDAQATELFDRLVGALIGGRAGLNFNDRTEVLKFSKEIDFSILFGAVRNLVYTIEAVSWSNYEGITGISVDFDTPFGRIVINDAQSQRFTGSSVYLLLLDLGGNDRYEAQLAATQSHRNAVSIAIDIAGDDRWGYAEMDQPAEVLHLPPADQEGRNVVSKASKSFAYRQGAGILGAGLLFDFAGNDEYQSLRLSQGASVGGVGILYDAQGDDRYLCEQGCQGASAFGIGLLVDRQGADQYTLAQNGQGFGGIRGAGALIDLTGNDRYMAILGDAIWGGDILYISAQNRTGSNSSFAQGAAFGRRADADGTYASGGVGLLRDEEGDDLYIADIFGQGTGYWFGAGVFSDVSGNDTYHGRWYVQGSSAHFALSLFYEGAGNDIYNPGYPSIADPTMLIPTMMATATGQGHDFSVGILAEYQGDDEYHAPGLGLGGGNDNGIGMLLEAGGRDLYFTPDGSTYGGSNSGERGAFFEDALCLGVFVDVNGDDIYANFMEQMDALIGNDQAWTLVQRREMRRAGMKGVGLDTAMGYIALPSLRNE